MRRCEVTCYISVTGGYVLLRWYERCDKKCYFSLRSCYLLLTGSAAARRSVCRQRRAPEAAFAVVHRAPFSPPFRLIYRVLHLADPASPCCRPNPVVPVGENCSRHKFAVASTTTQFQGGSWPTVILVGNSTNK